MDKWDIRFMKMAYLISEWTSCNVEGRSIGAVIVKDKRIMTTGYNGAPAGLKTCKERGECMRRKLNIESGTRAEVCYAIHAEQTAILQAAQEGAAETAATEASEGIQVLASYTLTEAQIENLVTAKGYADCVAFMGEDGISVVVSTDTGELTEADVAKVVDIAVSESGYPASAIKVMAAN